MKTIKETLLVKMKKAVPNNQKNEKENIYAG